MKDKAIESAALCSMVYLGEGQGYRKSSSQLCTKQHEYPLSSCEVTDCSGINTPFCFDVGKGKKRKDYAGQVWLRALRKGPLTSKLARASPRSVKTLSIAVKMNPRGKDTKTATTPSAECKPAAHLIKSKCCEDAKPGQPLETAQWRHADLCKNISGEIVTSYSILLGVGKAYYAEHTLDQFKQLGLDQQRAITFARKLHAHSVADANKLVTTRHATENTITSHSQVLEPGASSYPPDPH
eukprot:1160080-Pelagomonas_calceolata.AAC.17